MSSFVCKVFYGVSPELRELVPPDSVTVYLEGELDIFTAPLLNREVQRIDLAFPLVIELSELEYMDTAGIGALLAFHRQRKGAGRVCLCNPRRCVARVLSVVGFERACKIISSQREAIEA